MHVGTAVKLSCCSLAETMKLQCIYFCFARDTKKEILVTDLSKDKSRLISGEPRFHPKHYSKAALGAELAHRDHTPSFTVVTCLYVPIQRLSSHSS